MQRLNKASQVCIVTLVLEEIQLKKLHLKVLDCFKFIFIQFIVPQKEKKKNLQPSSFSSLPPLLCPSPSLSLSLYAQLLFKSRQEIHFYISYLVTLLHLAMNAAHMRELQKNNDLTLFSPRQHRPTWTRGRDGPTATAEYSAV